MIASEVIINVNLRPDLKQIGRDHNQAGGWVEMARKRDTTEGKRARYHVGAVEPIWYRLEIQTMFSSRLENDFKQSFTLAALNADVRFQIHLICWCKNSTGWIQRPIVRRDFETEIFSEGSRSPDEQKENNTQ